MLNKIELKEGTRVVTADGKDVGKLNRFVIDPITNEVTHIVVQKGWLLTEDKVVDIKDVASATEENVILSKDLHNFDDLPPYTETHFIRAYEGDLSAPQPDDPPETRVVPMYYWYPPAGYLAFPASGIGYDNWPKMQVKENIPDDAVALKEGSRVMSSDDKHVGNIERLFVDKDSNRATHFLISHGTLFKDRKLIPTHWVKTIREDKVQLGVSANVLETLPSYKTD